ncbi:MAG: C39 family peptidase [Proteobacteria bacterium]|nr:C39 family peptidase [Pseudomonadota bacterium]MBU1057541.1 C39 family peptidase [Pseudomonadota bacterium]
MEKYLSQFIMLSLLVMTGTGFAADKKVTSVLPESYMIENVPWHKQITGISCGAGSLEIVFDYWGPDIDQKEIADVARTSSSGTWPADIVRTGHFSRLSSAMGSFYPSMLPEEGFTARPIGYAAFSHSGNTFWLEELKSLIAGDIPVIVLMAYAPDGDVGHYRVVVGYDDAQQLIYFSDTWGRDIMKPSDFTGVISWSYADFELCWNYTDYSDLPYFGAVILPWTVELSYQGEISPGSVMTVDARITYPCPAPMDTSQFPARAVMVEIELPQGMTLIDEESGFVQIGEMAAGDTAVVTWEVRCDEEVLGERINITATALVDGAVPVAVWAGNASYYPAYEYTDLIGGEGSLQF